MVAASKSMEEHRHEVIRDANVDFVAASEDILWLVNDLTRFHVPVAALVPIHEQIGKMVRAGRILYGNAEVSAVFALLEDRSPEDHK